MKIRVFQKGFNYSQDGQGNRLVLHLQGCNMRCPWCANPEGMTAAAPLMTSGEKLLDSVCPHGAIRNGVLDRSVCKACAAKECVTVNKNTGIVRKCKSYDVDELVNEAVRCSPMFFDGGGVTLSGGEPTLQFDAVKEFFTKLKARGINTAIETNGTSDRLVELYPLIDQLIMDFKHYDSEKHKAVTKVGNEQVKANIIEAIRLKKPLYLRTPLINGFNASPDDIKGFLDFFKDKDTSNIHYEFLSYHEFCKDKWRECGYEYTMKNAFVTPQTLKAFEKAFRESGIDVIRT